MNRNRVLVLIGGILLIFGAIMPWASVTSNSLGLSRSLTGIEGDGILAALVGVVLLLIAIFAKGKPGAPYSIFAGLLALACGGFLLIKAASLSTFQSSSADISTSIGVGLLCISPLGVLLAVLGGFIRVPNVAPGSTAS